MDGAAAGDYVVLTVADTGAGMDATTLSRIFEPFFTTKPLGQGTGLGLSTVYGIARQHGGVIEIESAPGQGATFRLFLPRMCGHAGAAPEPAARRAATGGRGTILLVEDEPALLSLIGRVLRLEGYTVLDAATPFDAEALVASHDGPLDLRAHRHGDAGHERPRSVAARPRAAAVAAVPHHVGLRARRRGERGRPRRAGAAQAVSDERAGRDRARRDRGCPGPV